MSRIKPIFINAVLQFVFRVVKKPVMNPLFIDFFSKNKESNNISHSEHEYNGFPNYTWLRDCFS